ncbi:MAG: class I SAM-dependent methyltransferase [Candidatus Odinarchaeota archaeon]
MKQLQACGISGGTWVDAGCGWGAYTLPLSTLASKVIAIDKNRSNVSYLKNLPSLPGNIEIHTKDFNSEHFCDEPVNGVLFAFSLHYQLDPDLPLKNAYRQVISGGTIIVIDYTRTKPVPWVPYPLPRKEVVNLLESIDLTQVETVFENKRFYIVRSRKINE